MNEEKKVVEVQVEAKMEESKPVEEAPKKMSKKRYCVFVAYRGTGYLGSQINEKAPTIELELEKAMAAAGYIDHRNVGDLKKIGWQRAARTDKGVHAAANVMVAKLLTPNVENPLELMRDSINEHLPEGISVLGLLKVANSFQGKNSCTGRQYMYYIPTFVFAKHQQERPVLESAAPVKLLSEMTEEEKASVSEPVDDREAFFEAIEKAPGPDFDYRINEETVALVKQCLREYEGSHRFHNFTARMASTDKSSGRYITGFEVEGPFVCEGMEFLCLKVAGQSFLLHQIRKMIGLCVQRVRGASPSDVMSQAFSIRRKMNIPLAPSDGLFLAMPYFDFYNKKFAATHDKVDPCAHPDIKERMDKFKESLILPAMLQAEKNSQCFSKWVKELNTGFWDLRTIDLDLEAEDQRLKKQQIKEKDNKKKRIQKKKKGNPNANNYHNKNNKQEKPEPEKTVEEKTKEEDIEPPAKIAKLD
eukprot:TRINITY_DN8295_c0_g1_i1.p1 TRINITY_DN8295_c0_g1~~TRINITY_DN8295_c0_g1_i1.p1  ORF type:complete len:474 (-),score=180.54 TRINITY_DN8295_c0_g1_i1:144-1565(-)